MEDRGESMNIMDLCKAYAKISNEPMPPITVKERYDAGWISKYEVFDTFLRHEGIIGYTTKVITAFRICYELDQNKPGNPKGDPGLL